MPARRPHPRPSLDGEDRANLPVILTKVRTQSIRRRHSWLWILTFVRMTGEGWIAALRKWTALFIHYKCLPPWHAGRYAPRP